MKLVIAGSRHLSDPLFVRLALMKVGLLSRDGTHTITEIIEGGAKGIDSCARAFAQEMGIPYHTEDAQWKTYGPKAGPIRNGLMAKRGDALCAIISPSSKGTLDMIAQMTLLGKPVYQLKTVLTIVEMPEVAPKTS